MRLPTPIIALTVAAALVTAACTGARASEPAAAGTDAAAAAPATGDTASVEADDETTDTTVTAAVALADGELTDEEADGLRFMREEEKLAHDVYLTLYDLWGAPVFENIAASEQRHTDSVAALLDAYGLEDPVVDDAIGVFVNPDLDALYDQLVEMGSTSLVDALTVGALIEDLDISDLRSWLDRADDPAIERVYGNLLAGSENHLRAFVGQLEAQGAAYEPTYLTAEDIEAILAAGSGGGRGAGAGRRGPGH